MGVGRNLTGAVRRAVLSTPEGQPFTSAQLFQLGKRQSVHQALSRLVREGVIKRVGRGVFVRPEKSAYVADVPPEPIQIARLIAQRSNAVVQLGGAEAAQRLGLTSQVPLRLIFETSGPNRQFRLGSLTLRLRQVSARRLILSHRPAGIALAALWYLGKSEVTPATFDQIKNKLGAEEFRALTAARRSMPAWMVRALEKYEAQQKND